jgi:hypothetical protein
MVLASSLCALTVMAGAIGRTYRLDVLLVPASLASGMMAALGTTQADLGTIALVTLIVFSAKPVGPQKALASGALALSGGLFQMALTWVISLAGSGLVLRFLAQFAEQVRPELLQNVAHGIDADLHGQFGC